MTRPVGSAGGLAARAAPRRDQPDLAEHRNVDQRGAAGPGRARAPAVRARARPPARSRSVASPISPASARRITIGPGSTATVQRSSAALAREHRGRERMVQHQRAAGEQPRHDRAGEARERGGGERAEEHRVGLRCAPRGAPQGPPASSSAWLRATGTMPSAVMSKVTQRDVIGGVALALDRRRLVAARRRCRRAAPRRRAGCSPKPHRKRIVKVSAAMCIARSPCTTSPMRWQPISARAATRLSAGRRIGVAPQQRQRRGDQSGAQHGEQRDHALDRVGKLDRHHGVGRQPEARAAARRAPRSRGRPARR